MKTPRAPKGWRYLRSKEIVRKSHRYHATCGDIQKPIDSSIGTTACEPLYLGTWRYNPKGQGQYIKRLPVRPSGKKKGSA